MGSISCLDFDMSCRCQMPGLAVGEPSICASRPCLLSQIIARAHSACHVVEPIRALMRIAAVAQWPCSRRPTCQWYISCMGRGRRVRALLGKAAEEDPGLPVQPICLAACQDGGRAPWLARGSDPLRARVEPVCALRGVAGLVGIRGPGARGREARDCLSVAQPR